jgi:hypothetical protein
MRVALVATLLTMAGCSWFHRGSPKCREPTLRAGLADGAGLKVPAGPGCPGSTWGGADSDLNEPELPRGAKDPCLSMPPAYKTGQP